MIMPGPWFLAWHLTARPCSPDCPFALKFT